MPRRGSAIGHSPCRPRALAIDPQPRLRVERAQPQPRAPPPSQASGVGLVSITAPIVEKAFIKPDVSCAAGLNACRFLIRARNPSSVLCQSSSDRVAAWLEDKAELVIAPAQILARNPLADGITLADGIKYRHNYSGVMAGKYDGHSYRPRTGTAPC